MQHAWQVVNLRFDKSGPLSGVPWCGTKGDLSQLKMKKQRMSNQKSLSLCLHIIN